MGQGFRFSAMVAALLALAACRAPADGAAEQASAPMEMKLYDVPAAQTGRLAVALGGALGGHANVSDPAPGKLLVYAPRDAQASIAAALGELAKSGAAQAASTQVNLRFWIVEGRAGAGPDDPALKPLATTLDTLRREMGPLHFQLDQAVASLAASNHGGTLMTPTPRGDQRIFGFHVGNVEGDNVQLSLDYQNNGPDQQEFKTEVGTRFGQYLVLAQAPGTCPPSTQQVSTCADKPALRLLIVRVDRLNAHA
jgi:hypothetical protein